jgi:hypothetical protein
VPRSTIDGLTVEEIAALGQHPADFIREALERSGGRMTLVQHGKDGSRRVYQMTGVRLTGVTEGEVEGEGVIEELPSLEYLPLKV